MQLRIPDTNEFHPMEGYTGPIINRSGYSTTHVDKAWATDAPKAAVQPWWMAYHYIAQGDDPVAAAKFMLRILDTYRPNCLCGDLEEGAGNQQGRADDFIGTLHQELPQITDWDYSGLAFARAHLPRGVEWLAAYQGTEPTDHHLLWQASDKWSFPGMSAPCDGSIFNGSLADLLKLTNPTRTQETDMTPAVVTLPNGQGLVFVVGDDKHCYEGTAPNTFRDIGGEWTSGLTAQLLDDGSVHIFGRGTDGGLWYLERLKDGTVGQAVPWGGHIYPAA